MTEREQHRPSPTLSLITACISAMCFVCDVYVLMTHHPTGSRLVRDVAFLILFGLSTVSWFLRYRQFSAHTTADLPADTN